MTEQLTEDPAQALLAPAQPVRVPWATVPKVNLLPIAIVQGRRFKRTQRMLGLVVLTGVAVSAAGVFSAQHDVTAANADLEQAQSQIAVLNAQAAKYSAVPAVVSKVQAAQTARTSVMGQDVLWYRFLSDLDGALPSGVSQDSITLTLTPKATGQTGAPASAGPLTASGMGTLTVSGTASQYRQISALLESLDAVSGVASPSLTSATKSGTGPDAQVKYSLSAVVSDAALSHRYDKEGS